MAAKNVITNQISRADFGDGFVFGTACSAYQVEGAAGEGGRGPSNWDTITNQTPEQIMDGSNGNVAVNQYHLYKEDVNIMKKIGLDAHRFSISWSRILPGGRLSAGINREGIQYYNNLINELLANGIEPYVTLFHWDVPQALESEYGGFLNRKIVNDFHEYAELCFWEFGDRVKNWITLNEPWTFAVEGYTVLEDGQVPMQRCYIVSPKQGKKTPSDINRDPSRDPYSVAHNLLLAHADAVTLYRETFKAYQGGQIGISLVAQWYEPLHQTPEDKEAVERMTDFFFGWFMSPITYGKYPQRMRDIVQSRLPEFSNEESQALIGSFDFLGLNYYTARYVTNVSVAKGQDPNYYVDTHVIAQVVGPDGSTKIGQMAASTWLYIYPLGMYKILTYIKSRYNDPIICITENGVDEANDFRLTVSEAREDKARIQYHLDHLQYVKQAMDNDGVRVKGYFIWSLLDNFEWGEGYTVRFGLMYVNYGDKYERYPKSSALWFSKFLQKPQNAILQPSKGTKRAIMEKSSDPESDEYVGDQYQRKKKLFLP